MSVATPQSSKVFTRQEAAIALKCSLRTLDFLLATKALKAVRYGKCVRISVHEIDRFIEQGGAKR